MIKSSRGPTQAISRTTTRTETRLLLRIKFLTWFMLILVLFECCHLPLVVQAGEKGRDIIIYDGKVILKGGKKKGNIIISNGSSHGQGKYKYKKKYMDYGGYWK